MALTIGLQVTDCCLYSLDQVGDAMRRNSRFTYKVFVFKHAVDARQVIN